MSNVFYGTSKDETLLGTSGDDIFYVSSGNDKVWGGTGGTDTLVFTGALSDYRFTVNANGSYTMTDLRDGSPDGETTFRAIDLFNMNGQTYALAEMIALNENVYRGTSGDETLLGTAADDTFYASSGNDRIWGGVGGTDELVLSGAFADYSVKDNGDGSYVLTDMRDGSPAQSMVVRDIEVFTFADQTVTLAEMLAGSVNHMRGTDGDDVLLGSLGDDRFVGGAGNDVLWGNESGNDVAVYSGNMSDYKLVQNVDGSFQITDLRTGPDNDGSDKVRNVEIIEFADQSIALSDWLEAVKAAALIGDDQDNVLTGTSGDDVMQGNGGDDLIKGGFGDDVIYGDGKDSPAEFVPTGSSLPVFEIDGSTWQVIDGQIKKIDLMTGKTENIGPDHISFNAVALNPLDGYAYGIGDSGTWLAGQLLRIGSDGTYEVIAYGAPDSPAATFDNQGNLVVLSDKDSLMLIDVDTLKTQTLEFEGEDAKDVSDLVFVDDGAAGKVYGLNKDAELIEFDLNTMEITEKEVEGIDEEGTFGAGWLQDGVLYFSHNESGRIFSVSDLDSDEPVGAYVATGESSWSNDGFSYGDLSVPEVTSFGNDYLQGGHGNDELHGGGGDDYLNGGEGSDALFGDQGFDYADYSHAVTAISMSLVSGGLSGEAQGDTYTSVEGVVGSDFDDEIEGDAGNNVLLGHGGNDILTGGDGNDHLSGGLGDDVLKGGQGDNVLRGGEGRDVFALERNNGLDVIRDFVQGEDQIDLSAASSSLFSFSFLNNYVLSDFDDLSFETREDGVVEVSYEYFFQDYTFEVHGLEGVSLVETDFIF